MAPGGKTLRAALATLTALTLLVAGCGSSNPAASPTTGAPTTTSTSAPAADDSSTTSTTAATTATVVGELVEISVTGGEVAGGPARVEVPVGETVTIRVTADAADEVHVHGYDLTVDLAPAVASEISFTADIPGVFEVELEQSGLKIADLQVG